MIERFSSRWIYGVAAALFVICLASAGRAQERSAISLTVGTNSQPVQLNRAYKTIKIDNPEVVDVIPKTDHSFVLRPLRSGATELVVLDADNKVITRFPVLINSFIKIYNQNKLYGYEQFRCGPNGCSFDTVSK